MPPRVIAIWPREIEPEAASPEMMPSSTHPTASLAMPAARLICPKFRRSSPSSERIFATTGNDEMLNAVAMNSANTTCCDGSGMKRSGSAKPTASPPRNGTTRLPTATAAAARRKRLMRARSVSKPVTTNRSAAPTQLTDTIAAPCMSSFGRNQWKPEGHS